MPSYEIPESIVGVPLFVPSANDFFEIVSGGMPNGDDCLRVRGDLSTDYKAYVKAPTLTPDFFRSRATFTSMTFWFKSSNTANVATAASDTILGVMRADCNSANWSSADQVTFTFVIQAQGTSGIRVGASSSSVYQTINGVRDGNWHMITLTSVSNTYEIFVDGAAAYTGRSTTDTSPAPTGDLYFCIGSYSDGSNMDGWEGDFQIGKIAVHTTALDHTARQLLYNTMIYGP